MTCALCKEEKPLQNSHIISEFLFDLLYDDKHRFNLLTVRPGDRDRIEQKGLRERLLCSCCEQHIGRFERYGSQVLNGGAPGVSGEADGSIVQVRGIDYKMFKLFLLSLVWRAGVASGRFFEKVRLGPHRERIRLMILGEDPGPFDLYPCILFGMSLPTGALPGIMIQPCRAKTWGHTTYHLVLPGLKLVYFISSHRIGTLESQFVLQEDGSLVFQIRSASELPTLQSFMESFIAQGRRPRIDA